MKKLSLMILGALLSLPVFARDFSYTYEEQTLIYTVLDEDAKKVEVGKQHGKYFARVIIPSIAKDGDKEYSVVAIGEEAFRFCEWMTSIEIPNTVTSIGNCAFSFSHMTSIEIPASVTTIGNSAFYRGALTSINLPNSLTSIGNSAFSRCALTSIVLPNSLTSIGNSAFSDCALTSIEIPSSVTYIGEHVFYGCALTSIEVSAENPNYSSIDGVLFNKDSSILILFPVVKTGDYEIPSSVTSIGNSAFCGCSGLTSIDLPNSITSIGHYAFSGCSSLTSVEMPNSVTSIGRGAFNNCSGLTEANIPNSVTYIAGDAFQNCSSLTSVIIPNSVTSIGSGAFNNCNNLISVYYGADCPIEGFLDTFSDETYSMATLYVTETGKQLADTYYPWKRFNKIAICDSPEYSVSETGTDGIEELPVDIDSNLPCEVYNLGGVKVANTTDGLAPGIYIARQGHIVKKIAVK